MFDNLKADAPQGSPEIRKKAEARLAHERLLRENAPQQRQDLL
jgi:hypothetical protein